MVQPLQNGSVGVFLLEVILEIDNMLDLFENAHTGNWIAFSAAIITVIVNLMKNIKIDKIAFVKKIPARWRIAIPIILGAISGILSNICGGESISSAIYIGLFSGPSAVFLHEAVFEAIFGQSKTRQKNSK